MTRVAVDPKEARTDDRPPATASREGHLFTVITTMFHQAHLLPALREGLRSQTDRGFEWVVVDDGSLDGTESLLRSYQRDSEFQLRYARQVHRGTAVAWNRAVQMAEGSLVLALQPDEACGPDMIAKLRAHWERLAASEQGQYAGIEVHGRRLPRPWGCLRRQVLVRYLFPVIPDEEYISEAMLWNRVRREHGLLQIWEDLCFPIAGGEAIRQKERDCQAQNPLGARLYFMDALDCRFPWWRRFANGVHYVRHSLDSGVGVAATLADPPHFLLILSAFPFGAALWAAGRLRDNDDVTPAEGRWFKTGAGPG